MTYLRKITDQRKKKLENLTSSMILYFVVLLSRKTYAAKQGLHAHRAARELLQKANLI